MTGREADVMNWVSTVAVPALFDFMEEVMQAVSSSFSALEAFCNLTLVERMAEPRMVKTKGAKSAS